ncbi:MAG: zinc transporter ZupT [Lentisphaeria bacterium]|nr:zinc transporter ZupT [Lentisphaeria bacterium]
MEITWQVFFMTMGITLFAGMSTGLGGLVVFFTNKDQHSGRFLSTSLGFSAGVMIYISLVEMMQLARVHLGASYGSIKGGLLALLWFAAGLGMACLIDQLVPETENPHHVRSSQDLDDAEHASAEEREKFGRAGTIFALAIAIHNFPEGLATLAGGLVDFKVGIGIAVAIALHNIPEGMAVAVPILYASGSRKKAFTYALLSGLAEPAGALVGLIVLRPILTPELLHSLFALVAGIMIYISFDELLPMAEKYGEHHIALAGLLAGMLFIGAGLEFL